MWNRKMTKYRITTERLETIRKRLGSEHTEDQPSFPPEGMRARPSDAALASSSTSMPEAHLTDEQFIGYMMHALSAEEQRYADCHLAVCNVCKAEAERLRYLSGLWAEEELIQRLEDRIVTEIGWTTRTKARGATLPETIKEAYRTALRRLVLPQVAFGEGSDDASATVEFAVLEGDAVIAGLQGTLERRNREFFVRITAARPGDRERFGNRAVRITLSDPHQEQPILQCTIDVGVSVFLGTGLALTECSTMAAHLLPSTEVVSMAYPPESEDPSAVHGDFGEG